MIKAKELPRQELLKKLFKYKDGNLVWKIKLNPRAPIGGIAGYKDIRGYRFIRVNKKRYALHRLLWVYFYGVLEPEYEIDHIDRNPANNKIENLRKVTHWQNHANRSFTKRNTSGVVGVTWYEPTKKWFAFITRNHTHISLGYYKDLKKAANARLCAEVALDTFK